jgi:hypothetical protein
MLLSRTTLSLACCLWTGSASAAPVNAERAMDMHRKQFAPAANLNCGTSADPDEVVVCGRREGPDPNRLPLPVEPVAGERVVGEMASAAEVANRRETCTTVGRDQRCSGGLPILPILMGAAKLIADQVTGPN